MPDLNFEQFMVENPTKLDKEKIVDALYGPKSINQRVEIPLILLYDLWD